jgi:hypothetical protein
MKLSINRGLAAFLISGTLAILTVLAGLAWIFFHNVEQTLAADDLNVISVSLMDLYKKNPVPPEAEVDAQIRLLILGGAIGGRVNLDGKPADRYGTPFRIRHTVDGTLHALTATSAGPDGRFDTDDDVSRAVTWESLKQK